MQRNTESWTLGHEVESWIKALPWFVAVVAVALLTGQSVNIVGLGFFGVAAVWMLSRRALRALRSPASTPNPSDGRDDL